MAKTLTSITRAALGLSAGALAILAGQAARAESFYVVAGDARAMTLIDMDSIKRSGGMARAAEAVVYGAPQDKVFAMRSNLEFDCRGGKVHILSSTTYGVDDAPLPADAAANDWQDEAAGTPIAKFAKLAWGRMQPDPKDSMDGKLPALAASYRKAVANGAVR